LLKNPGFALVGVVTLALGIGVNLAVVTLVNALFFRPLPGMHEPGRLVIVRSTFKQEWAGDTSFPDYQDVRDGNSVFTDLCAFAETPFSLSSDKSSERVLGEFVSGNYFRTLGVTMTAGRDFLKEEDAEIGRNPVVIISERLWERRWNRDKGILGGTVWLNGNPFTVVGVTGGRYRGCQLPNTHDLWLPLHIWPWLQSDASGRLMDRGFPWLRLVGRLRPETNLQRAASDLILLGDRLASAYPGQDKDRSYSSQAYTPFPVVGKNAPRIFMGVLFGVTVVIVTVVYANVASLFLARLLSRRRDVAVRLALGASRLDLVRQTLAEAFLVSGIGLAFGLLVATQGSGFLLRQIPGERGEPLTLDLSLDSRVAWFSVALVLVSTLAVGLLPALQSSRVDVLPVLKANEGSISARKSRLRLGLVALQVSLCLPLLTAAGLLFRSLDILTSINLGMSVDHLLLVDLDPALNGYDLKRALGFYQQLLEHVADLPGVHAASLAALPPLGGRGVGPGAVYGGQAVADKPVRSAANFVSPDYFRTTGIGLLQGREFLPADQTNSQPVAIINQTLANKLWPDEQPLGQLLHLVGPGESPKLVVGIVQNAIYSDLAEDVKTAKPFYYLPLAQRGARAQTLHVRTTVDTMSLLPGVRSAVGALDPLLPLFHVTTLKTVRSRALFAEQITMELVSFSGVLAIVLAMLGLYTAIGQEVIARTREIGIRLAVGAQRREVVLMLVRQGMKLAGAGILAGMAAAFVLTRAIRSLLFGVGATDPLTFVVLLVVAIGIALLACWIPARRAARVDPIVALRHE
jgi:predicted permease